MNHIIKQFERLQALIYNKKCKSNLKILWFFISVDKNIVEKNISIFVVAVVVVVVVTFYRAMIVGGGENFCRESWHKVGLFDLKNVARNVKLGTKKSGITS